MTVYKNLAKYYDSIYGQVTAAICTSEMQRHFEYVDGWGNDVEFYYEEAKKVHGPVLEIGCGTGRILLPLLEKGIDITGIDLCKEMVLILKKKARDRALRPKIVLADMKNFSLNKKFNLVIIPYRAFLHMLTEEDQLKTLQNIKNHLNKNGKLIIHSYCPMAKELKCTGQVHHSVEITEHKNNQTGKTFLIHWDIQYSPKKKILRYFLRRKKGKNNEIKFSMRIAYIPDKKMHTLLKKFYLLT
jgi:SAM-dependent methyltransferase